MGSETKSSVHFGHFEVNLNSGELRKNGTRVRLQQQPFQLLVLLLERPGEVVTREELKQRLWADDTFVDFDHGVASGISKIRQALNDTAENPRFIETLPKRGYRFIAPVTPQTSSSPGEPPELPRNPPRRLRRFGVAIACLGAAAIPLWLTAPRRDLVTSVPQRRFTIVPPGDMGLRTQMPFPVNLQAEISPDGKKIAFSEIRGRAKLWIYDLEKGEMRAIEGTDGATGLFWSPDSAYAGFFQNKTLYKVRPEHGVPIVVCEFPGMNPGIGAWHPSGDSIIAFSCTPARSPSDPEAGCRIWQVPAAGGTPVDFMKPSGEERRQQVTLGKPVIIPRGSRISGLLYFVSGPRGERQSLRVLNPATGERRVIVHPEGAFAAYASTGHILFQNTFMETGVLWALPFSPDTLQSQGKPIPVADDAAVPSVSNEGTLVYVRHRAPSQQLAILDRLGREIQTIGPSQERLIHPSLAPNGREVLVSGLEKGVWDIWIYDMVRSIKTRLTADPDFDQAPIWGPDGRTAAYTRERDGETQIVLKGIDPGAGEQILSSTRLAQRANQFFPDGRALIYERVDRPGGKCDLWQLSKTRDGVWEQKQWLHTPFEEGPAKFSPKGDYIVYQHDFSGRNEIYVRAFPRGERLWQISRQGGIQPRWSRDGAEIYFVAGSSLYAVAVRTEPEFSAGPPAELFAHASLATSTKVPAYDVMPDRKGFVVTKPVGTARPVIQVVQNWLAAIDGRGR